MSRSPIYQTFSTRILVPRRRSPWRVGLIVLALAALATAGLALGRGLATPEERVGGKPAATSAPRSVREELVRSFEGSPTAQPATQAAPAPAEAVQPNLQPPAAPATSSRQVVGTEGAGLQLRAAPGLAAEVVGTLSEGTQLSVSGDGVVVDGLVWLQARDASGQVGWVAEEYLRGA
jgi:hypothetical protein